MKEQLLQQGSSSSTVQLLMMDFSIQHLISSIKNFFFHTIPNKFFSMVSWILKKAVDAIGGLILGKSGMAKMSEVINNVVQKIKKSDILGKMIKKFNELPANLREAIRKTIIGFLHGKIEMVVLFPAFIKAMEFAITTVVSMAMTKLIPPVAGYILEATGDSLLHGIHTGVGEAVASGTAATEWIGSLLGTLIQNGWQMLKQWLLNMFIAGAEMLTGMIMKLIFSIFNCVLLPGAKAIWFGIGLCCSPKGGPPPALTLTATLPVPHTLEW